MIKISYSEFIEKINSLESVSIYEYYDGYYLNDEYHFECDDCTLNIFDVLDNQSLVYFKFTTRFPSEYSNINFKISPSLKFLHLPTYDGIEIKDGVTLG